MTADPRTRPDYRAGYGGPSGSSGRGPGPGGARGAHAAHGAPPGGMSGWWQQARTDPGWILLPLRLFLGFTFTYAGVDKLSDRAFFDPADPTSIAAQIAAFRQTSPLRPILGFAADHATLFGVMIALGEIAVGVAVLLGVRVRLAALGGALISLSLLLTVTWETRPYYYGSDIAFLFGWLPLIVYGSGTVLSLQYATWRRWGARGGPAGNRRAVLAQIGAAGVVAGATALLARLARGDAATTALPAGDTRAPSTGPSSPAASATTSPSAGATSAAPTGTALAKVSDVPVGKAVEVTIDKTAAYLVHVNAGTFAAFSRTCTHAGCKVNVSTSGTEFDCPCHQSRFNASTGAVIAGPAPRALDTFPVQVVGEDVRTTS